MTSSRLPFRRDRASAEPALDPSSWFGAIIVMVGVAALLWIVQVVNSAHRINEHGLQPRHLAGLIGIVTMPFLHADWNHLYSNTLPLILIGWVLLLAGLRTWLVVTALVVLGGGLLTWLVAPGNENIVGASGLIFGWLGYLLARALFSREVKWVLIAIVVLFFFGTLLFGVLPTASHQVSWQAHACGFAAGVGAAALLHRTKGQTALFGRAV
ncbi:MAG: rhomboid family intramembrane serine protease [Jatrophihabitans sp.]